MRYLIGLFALAIVSHAPAQTVRLQLKFPAGRVDRMIATTSMTQGMTMAGTAQPMNMTMNQSMSMLMKVVSSDVRGGTVKVTYESAKMATLMNGKPFSMGAGDPSAAVKGKSYTVHFLHNGNVDRIDGLDKMMNNSLQSANPQMRQAFQQLFSEKSMRDMWGMFMGGMIPDHPVKAGDTWTSSLNFGQAPMEMALKMRMKLVGIETRNGHRMARIGVSGSGSMNMSGMMPGLTMKTDRFELSGVSLFDMDRGWFNDQNLKMLVHGSASMAAQGKTQTMGFLMNMTSTTRITPVK